MSTSRVFVGRLAGRGVFDPVGDRIGKVRDVLVVFRAASAPRVVGLIVEIPGKRRVFVPIGRVTSIGSGQVITTGLINVRRFEQRGGETRMIAELIGRDAQLAGDQPGGAPISARIEDAAIERSRTGEWLVSEVFVRLPKPAAPFSRGDARIVRWSELQFPSDAEGTRSAELLIQTLVDLKPADLAEALLELPQPRMIEVIEELADERVADALEEMSEQDQLELLAQLPADRTADVLDQMEPDDAADLISALPAAQGAELLDLMEPEEAEDVRRLLEYDADTAGGLMSPAPIVLAAESSVAEGLAMIRRAEISPAMASAVYVTHPPYETPTGEYIGLAHFQRMLRFPPHERMASLLDAEIEPVTVHASAAEVSRRLASYNLVALPVVDDQQRLVGVVTVDDVLDHLLPDDWRHADDDAHTPSQTAPVRSSASSNAETRR
ncbi:magnesium transporter MgtE N-terminal domain-containing protein [Leucobacter japonicus]|uniref:magnesium transporter MgtE N-terminal domain-containing protein n=1 Tax=Leucobacter japonicus TaxID=1461259 RepID=UPI0006A7A4D3|nr:CBS domain-containing protein [Leucobacter japonicus]